MKRATVLTALFLGNNDNNENLIDDKFQIMYPPEALL